MKLHPDHIWLFDVTIQLEQGDATALAVSIARRSAAARLVLEQKLNDLGVSAKITRRGSLAAVPLDDAEELAMQIDDQQAAIGPFGYDDPRLLTSAAAFSLSPMNLDAIAPLLFEQPARSEGEQLHTQPQPYALLDATRVFGLPEILETSGLEYSSLFIGKAAQDYADTAPYLVRLRHQHALTTQLLAKDTPDQQLSWLSQPGILIQAPLSMSGLKRHLRKFTFLHDNTSNKRSYFRFYDPRIFEPVFANATEVIQARFMQGISSVIFPRSDGQAMIFAGT